MKIGLIDVDHSRFPNIALMKISAYHKAQGDDVEWYSPFEHYNRVYVSKVFSFSEATYRVGGAKLPAYGAHIKGDRRVFMCAL